MGERSIPAGRGTQLISLLVLEQRAQQVTLDRELGLLAWRSLEPQPRRGRENYAVPISEIIAVEEKEREAKQSQPGRWQKIAKPHAFTGKENKPLFSANSFKIINMLA
uniref:Ceramide kinase PH domain-containing protein n=1 Tax=Micrurus corallinus TaxID=54390 RepID=A0A2D4GF08_MICCO